MEMHPGVHGMGATGDVKQYKFTYITRFDMDDHVEMIRKSQFAIEYGIMDTMSVFDTIWM